MECFHIYITMALLGSLLPINFLCKNQHMWTIPQKESIHPLLKQENIFMVVKYYSLSSFIYILIVLRMDYCSRKLLPFDDDKEQKVFQEYSLFDQLSIKDQENSWMVRRDTFFKSKKILIMDAQDSHASLLIINRLINMELNLEGIYVLSKDTFSKHICHCTIHGDLEKNQNSFVE